MVLNTDGIKISQINVNCAVHRNNSSLLAQDCLRSISSPSLLSTMHPVVSIRTELVAVSIMDIADRDDAIKMNSVKTEISQITQ